MATQEMWRMVQELLAGKSLPQGIVSELEELCNGTSTVEPEGKILLNIKMLEAGMTAFKRHGDDIAATVVEIYKAMRAERIGIAVDDEEQPL